MTEKKMLGYMYDFYNNHVLRGQNDDIDYYKEQIKKYSSKKVLVVGAGTGRVAIPLHEIAEVVALDFDEGRLEILNEKCSSIKTICCDIRNFNTNESFDMIIFPYSTLQFSNSSKDINKILMVISSFLKDHSVVLFDLSESFSQKRNISKKVLFEDYCTTVQDDVQVVYSSKKYKQYIEFNVEYKLKYKGISLLEHEKYFYYDKAMLKKLMSNNHLKIIEIHNGYGKQGFNHKHIYHCKKVM